jgi:hypothetical protein
LPVGKVWLAGVAVLLDDVNSYLVYTDDPSLLRWSWGRVPTSKKTAPQPAGKLTPDRFRRSEFRHTPWRIDETAKIINPVDSPLFSYSVSSPRKSLCYFLC